MQGECRDVTWCFHLHPPTLHLHCAAKRCPSLPTPTPRRSASLCSWEPLPHDCCLCLVLRMKPQCYSWLLPFPQAPNSCPERNSNSRYRWHILILGRWPLAGPGKGPADPRLAQAAHSTMAPHSLPPAHPTVTDLLRGLTWETPVGALAAQSRCLQTSTQTQLGRAGQQGQAVEISHSSPIRAS